MSSDPESAEPPTSDSESVDSLSKPRRIDLPDDQSSSFGEGFDDKRLWVGNLDPKVTEFAVLKIAEKFGHIRKLDFIYHKGGPDKGLSKGYCFISFNTWEAAEQARKNLDGKLFKGRRMFVKWAHGSKFDELEEVQKKVEGPTTAKSVDTALAAASLPTGNSSTSASPQSKIHAIEAKLKMMEDTQKDFGLHHSIQANPAYNPLSMMQKTDNRKGSRPGPYRRGQSSGSGHRSRPRR